jgi:hypothetical protein
MLPSQASELKQQAIIDKARDPESSVSPAAAKEAIVQEATAAGGAAYNFDPNATKEEKAAQLDSVRPRPHPHAPTLSLRSTFQQT